MKGIHTDPDLKLNNLLPRVHIFFFFFILYFSLLMHSTMVSRHILDCLPKQAEAAVAGSSAQTASIPQPSEPVNVKVSQYISNTKPADSWPIKVISYPHSIRDYVVPTARSILTIIFNPDAQLL